MKSLLITSKFTNIETNSFKKYLSDISEIALFTPEEELVCARKVVAGDILAKIELINRNLRFVVSIAKRYVSEGNTIEDLVNEGNIGLIAAVDRFDPEKGFKFISYAVFYIRKVIMEYLTRNSKLIRLPLNKISKLSKLEKQIRSLEQEFCRNVNVIEAIDSIDIEMSDKEIEDLKSLYTFNVDSLDREITLAGSEVGSKLSDMMEDTSALPSDHIISNEEFNKSVKFLLQFLDQRDRKIMIYLYGLDGNDPLTFKLISDKIGITTEMVRQIKEKSLRLIRNKLKTNPSLVP